MPFKKSFTQDIVYSQDDYEKKYDYEENVKKIKKKIAEGKEPLASLGDFDFKAIFGNMVILDQNEFGLVINTSNKKLVSDDYDNPYVFPALLKGKTHYKKKRIDLKSNWEILVI